MNTMSPAMKSLGWLYQVKHSLCALDAARMRYFALKVTCTSNNIVEYLAMCCFIPRKFQTGSVVISPIRNSFRVCCHP